MSIYFLTVSCITVFIFFSLYGLFGLISLVGEALLNDLGFIIVAFFRNIKEDDFECMDFFFRIWR